MTMVPLDFYGVHTLGPENFVCVLLHSRERDRVLPVWISPVEGARLTARQAQWEPDRPDTYDLLASIITQSTSGATAVEITSYYNGTFIAEIQMQDGEEIDSRVSDAVLLAQLLDLPISADGLVVSQAGIWVSREDARQHFGIDLPEPFEDVGQADASASGDATADEEFAEMMRNMGVDASDLGADDADGANDTDVTKDDNDES